MKTYKSYVLVPPTIQALMSGACAAFASGDTVTLKYTDGTSETAECPEEAELIRNHAKYQAGNIPFNKAGCAAPKEPNFFSIVSAVQSKRISTLNA